MIRLLFSLIILCSLANSSVFAQKNFDITGIVSDTTGEPLLSSTIMLLDTDSVYVDFSRSGPNGDFEFKKVKNGDYIIKITFVGMIPQHIPISSTGENIDLGVIKMTEIAEELMEIVVKAARAPISIRGDTIEYDATTFKVPEGSSVEDLLRKLPGMQIGQEGDITADGQDVTKVTVDGKEFFGGDPKAATKNLQAEAISKVQVYDTTTEEEEVTGQKDAGNQDKTLNLELKEEFKSGGFGKVIVGAGTEDRKELKGNFNRFNDKMQFSLIGVGNNTGRNGLSWDDYRGFMGSNSWNFNDGSDYGFGSGGGFIVRFGGGEDDGLENSLQDIFFSGNQTGFPEFLNGGVNFNYDHNKSKLSAYYFVNKKGLQRTTTSERETFLANDNALEESLNDSETDAIGHKAEFKWEQELDSLHTIKFTTRFAAVDNEGTFDGSSFSQFASENFPTNTTDYNNLNNTAGHLINGQILLRKKFKKNKRRRLGFNTSYQYSTVTELQDQMSLNEFFDQGVITSQQIINQNYDNLASKDLWKINGLYVEPISKKLTLQTFYNYSNRQEVGDRDVVDVNDNSETVNTFLTRDYENDITLNRIGTSLKYAHEGVNVSIGMAYQDFLLKGLYEGVSGSDLFGEVDNRYSNWIPNASINFSPLRNSWMSISYTVNAQEPSIRNLQPILDNSNPFYLREGNPELVPEISKSINSYLHFSRPMTGFRVYANLGYTSFTDQIITEETIDENLVTFIRPINYDGGSRFSLYSGITLPIKTNKLTIDLNIGGSSNNSFSIVNGVVNETKTTNLDPRIRLNITPSDKFALYLNTRYNRSAARYNINSNLDQNSSNFNYGVELNTDLVLGLKLNTDFNMNMYRNDRLGNDQNVPILNFSIYRQFLESNKGELRLSVFDAFNENISVGQFASNYFITRSNTTTLARYVMLSFTYNIKGMNSSNKKRRWH